MLIQILHTVAYSTIHSHSLVVWAWTGVIVSPELNVAQASPVSNNLKLGDTSIETTTFWNLEHA